MIIYQILAICGMLSPIIYTAMWVIVGSKQSGYNHIQDDISSLFAVGAPHRRLAQSFIITESVLLFVFFIGLHEGINDGGGSIIGPILFLIASVLGILIALFFPLDEGGEFTTYKGKMHITLVVLMGLLTIAGMIALWIRLQFIPIWNGFAIFSLISAIASLIGVIISGIFASGKHRGIIERIMVTPYQLFYFVLALMVFLNN
ncbi:MAG: DUF998 domain-containing protein [Candidatus Lokiarchaeota archaeon]|nr:DUF998 domain-containing protein [Candidatus Lokiarchaeota archaeon]